MAPNKQARTMRYVGASTVAGWLGVTSAAISVYRRRYADTDYPCPEPDAVIGDEREVPGWLPSREAEWRAWDKKRPGQGVGGGRPPLIENADERVRARVRVDGTVRVFGGELRVGKGHARKQVTVSRAGDRVIVMAGDVEVKRVNLADITPVSEDAAP